MKNITRVILVLALVALAGCSEDFLELNNKNELSSGNFWDNERQVQQGLVATYAALQTEWGDKWEFFEQQYIGLTYRADDIENNAAEPYGKELAAFTYNTEEATISKLWSSCYAGIARANQLIQETPKVSELTTEKQNEYIGEAKFLRAYYYFLLVNSFVNIPKITVYSDELTPAQVSPSEIWSLIESDLQDAENTIVESHPDEWKGRVTKWSAKAFLGKVYLFQEKWTLAEAKFKEVVDANVYDLLPNYADNFNGLDENGVESVFEIQFTSNNTGGVDERNPFNWEVTPYALDGWELFYPSAWLMDEMMLDKTTDDSYSERVYESVFFDDAASTMRYPTGTDDIPYADVKESLNHPYYFKKFNAFTDRRLSYIGTNIPVIRYADVLLMYAEALNENNKTSEAIEQINIVRERSGASPIGVFTKDALRTQIRHHERPVELAMEWGIRWFDLLRWSRGAVANEPVKTTLSNHDKPNVENFVIGKHDVNPIPFSEISLNPNIQQNDNW